MLCRFVFSLWWSIFVWGIWWHLRQPLHVWTVDRHQGKTVKVSQVLKPIVFANASVLWVDKLTDLVHLDLKKTPDAYLGNVKIASADMLVFEDGFRDNVMEKYSIEIGNVTVEDAHLDLTQGDIHLSPFRRIEISPSIDWTLGSAEVADFVRPGRFKDGKWYEGRDSTQLGFGALFAWCMGVVFLVVMRRGNQGAVVVKRQKRIFK